MASPHSIPARFAQVVAQHRERIAVRTAKTAWSYSELDRRANRVAARLQALPGDCSVPAALLLSHGPPLIAAILGVLKSGRMYLALDPADSPERLAALLRHSGADRLLVEELTRSVAARLPFPAGHLVNLDDDEGPTTEISPDEEPPASAPAWLMYTSGSTGEPKGVWQSHGGVLHLSEVYAELINLQPRDHLSWLTPAGLAASATAIFGALLNGAMLCPFHLRDQGVERLTPWLAEQEITVLHTVPTILRHAIRASSGNLSLPNLRLIRLGGELILRADVELIRQHLPRELSILHAYSSTETGLACACWIDSKTQSGDGPLPIGTAVRGAEVTLVDDRDRPVAAGEAGRIAVRSAGVAGGYWRPANGQDGAFELAPAAGNTRRFLTADLGQRRSDGLLVHLGRMDQQVKIHGLRVDLATVENALRTSPDIEEAAAVVDTGGDGRARLIAYVVPRAIANRDGPQLRRRLARSLPAHLVPVEVVWLDRLPLTAGGKIDRRSLPPVPSQPPAHSKRVHSPRDWFEKGIAAIWETTLKVQRIDRTADFFELGGGSIESAQVLARIEDEYDVALPPSTLLEHPTIEQLAALLSQRTVSPVPSPLVCLRAGGAGRPVFLVHGGKGDVAQYGQLARRLSDRPVYAFQAVGLNALAWPLTSIPAMARCYREELQTVDGTGPYLLMGACMGGLIAFEMASQLARAGGRVGRLMLINTDYPAPAGRRLRRTERFIEPFRDTGRILRWSFLRWTGLGIGATWLPAYRRFVHAMNRRARRAYRPRHYPGELTLLLARDVCPPTNDLRLMMERHASTIRRVSLDGCRTRQFLSPEVDELAGKVNGLLAGY